MRAREFIKEDATKSLQDDVSRALPMTYTIPALQNQDPYKQYRFGVAIAKAKSSGEESEQEFQSQSPWGENLVVVGYSNTVDQYIDAALAEMGLGPGDKKLITTPRSEETTTVNKSSPVAKIKRNKYGI